jgi:hypothetical protein
MTKNSFITMVGFLLAASGCSYNTANTPAGKTSSGMIAAGLFSWSDLDTTVSFENCRLLLDGFNSTTKPDKPMEHPELYNKCWDDAMVGVTPDGKRSQPTPVDTNNDGKPDVVRYATGLQVPYDLYALYPGAYWPGVYSHYYERSPLATNMVGGAYGPTTYLPHAPLGESENAGSLMDPTQAAYAQANATRAANAPSAPPAQDNKIAERLEKVVKHVKMQGEDIRRVNKKVDELRDDAGLNDGTGGAK